MSWKRGYNRRTEFEFSDGFQFNDEDGDHFDLKVYSTTFNIKTYFNPTNSNAASLLPPTTSTSIVAKGPLALSPRQT